MALKIVDSPIRRYIIERLPGQEQEETPDDRQGTYAYRPQPKRYTPEQQEALNRLILQKRIVPATTVQQAAKTGVFLPEHTPERFKRHVSLPEEIKSVGATAEDIFYTYAYQVRMGVDPYRTGTGQRLSRELSKSRYWWETYAIFEGGKRWKDVKREEPALFLYRDPKTGVFSPQFDFKKWYYEAYRPLKDKKAGGLGSAAGDIAYSFLNIGDVGTWKAAISGKLPSYHARKEYENVRDIQKGKGFEVWARIQAPFYTTVILPAAGGYAIGAGIGALKATSIGSKILLTAGSKSLTVGKAVEFGIAGYGAYEIGKSAIRDPLGTGIGLAMGAPFAVAGYKAGHTMGFGRAEAYLYGKHTFAPGSAEMIRFKSAIKVARKLEVVKSHKMRPLDIAKDISRLDVKSASRVIGFLKQHPKTVIGGSSASYTQIVGARTPRDIDILVKDTGSAKSYFKGYSKTPLGKHRIDIHSWEYGGKGGRYHRFGFITKEPVRIGEHLYMRGGEQVFRKGIAGTTIETKYRWFKDYQDFITHSKSLMISAKKSYNPINWLRGRSAGKHLDIFMHPKKTPVYGKSDSFLGSVSKRLFKPGIQPKLVDVGGGYYDYIYPSYVYPSSIAGAIAPSSYLPAKKFSSSYIPSFSVKNYVKLPTDRIVKQYPSTGVKVTGKPVYTDYKKPDDSKPYVPSYQDSFTPKFYPSDKISLFPSVKKRKRRIVDDPFIRKVKPFRMPKMGKLGYRERDWPVQKIESMLDIGKIGKDLKIKF